MALYATALGNDGEGVVKQYRNSMVAVMDVR